MNTFVVAFCAALAVAHAGVIEIAALPSAKLIQGPSSRTTVVGNDGSVISSVAPGGSIVTEEHDGFVAHAAPAAVAHAVPVAAVAHAAPTVVAHAAPVVAAETVVAAPATVVSGKAHLVAHAAPVAVAHAAPVVGAHTVIAGPSGSVVSGKSHLVAHAAPVVAADAVVAGPSGTVVSGRSHLVAPVVAHHSVATVW